MALTATVTVQTDSPVTVARVGRRRDRYAAQRLLWRETRLKRLAYCGRIVNDSEAGVGVKVTETPEGRRAGFSGLQTCGSVWACPVCSEKVNAVRQGEVEAALRSWIDGGGSVIFGTLTMRHNKGHRLADLWDAIGPAWNRTTSGCVAWSGSKKKNGYIGDKAHFGVAGIVRVVEVKWGRNGWHPHIHFLMFLERDLTPAARKDLEGRLFARWETALAKRGFSVLREVGIDLRPVTADDQGALGSYFMKQTYAASAAYEVTGSQSKRAGKGGRTPFQLLSDVVELGDADALDRWHEWEKASTGRRQLTWTRGLRKLLGLDAEKTDEEIAESDELDGEDVVTIAVDEWKRLGWANRRDELLEAAERSDKALRRLVARARGFAAVDPPPD